MVVLVEEAMSEAGRRKAVVLLGEASFSVTEPLEVRLEDSLNERAGAV